MAKYSKFIVSLLTPVVGWAVAAGFLPTAMSSPEFIASAATVVSGLVYLVANK